MTSLFIADLSGFFIVLFSVLLGIISVLLVLIVLMQRPKQEGLGAAFGGGMTDQMFGAQTTNVLQKGTVYLAVGFFFFALTISVLTARNERGASKTVDDLTEKEDVTEKAPAKVPGGSVFPTDPSELNIKPEVGTTKPIDIKTTPPVEAGTETDPKTGTEPNTGTEPKEGGTDESATPGAETGTTEEPKESTKPAEGTEAEETSTEEPTNTEAPAEGDSTPAIPEVIEEAKPEGESTPAIPEVIEEAAGEAESTPVIPEVIEEAVSEAESTPVIPEVEFPEAFGISPVKPEE